MTMYIASRPDGKKDSTLAEIALFNLSVDLNVDPRTPVEIDVGLLRGVMSSAYEAGRQHGSDT
jgi:hypothetical protein